MIFICLCSRFFVFFSNISRHPICKSRLCVFELFNRETFAQFRIFKPSDPQTRVNSHFHHFLLIRPSLVFAESCLVLLYFFFTHVVKSSRSIPSVFFLKPGRRRRRFFSQSCITTRCRDTMSATYSSLNYVSYTRNGA